jgi:sulfite reductase (ferredoxin)
LLRMSDISDEYATGNLHLTTRQDIQIHYVSLEKTPELWAKLEQDNITLREACGNTVRNVTASATAGIDPDEPFDVSPYAQAAFEYFLRNPICQDMGRKIKIAFSSSDKDTAFTYMHDLGFIPKIKKEGDKTIRGFKVVVGGGLGAQPFLAKTAHEFLHEDLIIPYTEAVLRVFDRHGERTSRHKARLKFLINKLGFEEVVRLFNEEHKALKVKEFKIAYDTYPETTATAPAQVSPVEIKDQKKYEDWLKTNVFEQKQKGFYGVYMKVLTGDIKTPKARLLADIVKKYAADDIRITVNQGLMIKFVRKDSFKNLFVELDKLGLADPGFDSTGDVTTCPGTDTCNLGISNSTGITGELEKLIKEEYPDLIFNSDIKIKISGCMNGCGQHSVANIGFHGSSLKSGPNVLPALQVLLGGGTVGNGEGRVADKVLKVPSKRALDVLRKLLDDYDTNAQEGEYFNDYYVRNTEKYFYTLLKPFTDLSTLKDDDFVDWGHEVKYSTAIGVGECAGVMIDLVATLLYEAEEKHTWAKESLSQNQYADSIYHSYSVFVSTAKALLLDKQVNCNTQHGIINDFDKNYVATGLFKFDPDFKTNVLQINKNEPSEEFAKRYFAEAEAFLSLSKSYREKALQNN